MRLHLGQGWATRLVNRLVPALLASGLMLATGTPSAGSTAVDDRFAVIVGGSTSAFQYQLDTLGTLWWYAWGSNPSPAPGHREAEVIHTYGTGTPLDLASLRARAAASPGRAWIIGNEPNVPGQDDIPPASYATLLHDYALALKEGDPGALVVAPNTFNFDVRCGVSDVEGGGCGPFSSGQTWLNDFLQAYQSQYGGMPPIDVWGVHPYYVNWNDLPMTNFAVPQQQARNFADFVRSLPGQEQKPIWLTEFGVSWGCPTLQWVYVDPDWKAYCAQGTRDAAGIDLFLTRMGEFVRDEGPGLNIERAFVFSSHASPEPYALVWTGVQLFDQPDASASLTSNGRIWQTFAGGPLSAPTSTPVPTATATSPPTVAPTATVVPTVTAATSVATVATGTSLPNPPTVAATSTTAPTITPPSPPTGVPTSTTAPTATGTTVPPTATNTSAPLPPTSTPVTPTSTTVPPTPVAGASISASQNPVTGGTGNGSMTITWSTGTTPGGVGEVRLSLDGGAETLFAQGASGQQTAAFIQAGHSYRFRLYQGAGGSTVLAQIIVTRTTAAPSISASPNPTTNGTTTISWFTGNGSDGQVWVSQNGAPEVLFAQNVFGSASATWIQTGSTYRFTLYQGTTHSTAMMAVDATRSP